MLVASTLAVVACATPATTTTAEAPASIAQKGEPYADLLEPWLQSSVTYGAVGVPVDTPVTVKAGDGVLGAV